MAFNTASGNQIKHKQITDDHIKTKLSESKLQINYSDVAKSQKILEAKKLIDGITLLTPITVLANATVQTGITLSTTPAADASSNGVSLDDLVNIVDASSGDVIVSTTGKQIYGKLEYNAVNSNYDMTFVESDGVTPSTVEKDVNIKIQYYIRDDLWNVSERFLKNERLAEGIVEISQHKNTKQIIADLFGAGYVFNGNGTATDNFSGNVDLESLSIKEALLKVYEEVSNARTDKDGVIRANLSTRIDLTEQRMENLVGKSHKHITGYKEIKVDNGDNKRIVDFIIPGVKATDDIKVFYNGMKQIKDKHFSINVLVNTDTDTNKVTITFTSDMTGTILDPDYVEIETIIYM